MQVDITTLLKQIGNTKRLCEDVTMLFSEEELAVVGPVALDLVFTHAGSSVLVKGHVRASAKTLCARCGEEMTAPIDAEIEDAYQMHSPEVTEENQKELTEEDFVFVVQEDHLIVLDELIRQNLILSMPVRPLCSATCPGPKQGGASPKHAGDPRLSVLQALRHKLPKGS